MEIKELAEKYEDYIIDLRRHFHTYPELSWQEEKTSQKIKEELDRMNISYVSVAGTGVIATIEGDHPGPVIGLRADMDALNIVEKNEIEYCSKNTGVMHACGHDSHVAMLLGVAKILKEVRGRIQGRIKLIFQPAEEIIEGAKQLVQSGELEDLDFIYALHSWADLDSGGISLEAGPRMASADKFSIKVHGKGGHGASPHQGIDAALVASSILLNLQSLVSREIDPLEAVVVSIGKLNAGEKYNVIAKEAYMEGTTRCFNKEIRQQLPIILERIALNIAKAYRAKIDFHYEFGTPPTINSEACSQKAHESAIKLFGEECIVPMTKIMGGEDFAIYLEKVPGALIFLGARETGKEITYPHHHGKFNINENVLKNGTALLAQIVMEHCN